MQPEKTDLKQLANALFEQYPETDVFHFTADKNAFIVAHEAFNHSLKLKDKTVTEIYRPDMTAAEIKALKAQQEAELQQGAETAYREAFPELARSIDYNKSNRRE